MHSERAPLFLKIAAWGGVIFLHFPLAIIAIYAFNTEDAAFSFFPPQGLTLRWFSEAAGRGDIFDAVTLSLKIYLLDVHCLNTWHACCSGSLATGLWQKRSVAVADVADCAAGHCHRPCAADGI